MLSEVCHCVNSMAVCLSTECTHFFRVLSFIGTAFSFCLFYGHVMLMVFKKKKKRRRRRRKRKRNPVNPLPN